MKVPGEMLQGREVGWQREETKDREQKDPPNCALGTGEEEREVGAGPSPLPSALGPASSSTSPPAQRQPQGVTAWALSHEPAPPQGKPWSSSAWEQHSRGRCSVVKSRILFFLMVEKYKS